VKKLHRTQRPKDDAHKTSERRHESRRNASGVCQTCEGRGNILILLPQPLYARGTTTRINCPECGGDHGS